MIITQEDTDLLLQKSLEAIRKLKQMAGEAKLEEPIAIVGMSCHFPGNVHSPEEFWQLLSSGEEGISSPPKNRWNHDNYYDPDPTAENKMYIKESAFLSDNIKEFDPKLFHISPREAEEIDPQHRLLLELSWEALENAAINPQSLKNSKTGVFIGIIASEYAMLERDQTTISPYTLTGMTPHMASGRISHFYGFQGPSLSIDTACSSSLVCLHEACKSLNRKECDMALIGGVNLMVSPEALVSLCKIKALSKDGRCKPFDASGDGYGRGEGGGVLVLKRLSDARKNQDQIFSIVKGSAINHDGPSSGLTVPNVHAQIDVMQKALIDAKLSPNEIDFLEAHGTGTHLGDPIEIQAIDQVYGSSQRRSPLMIGTCKANIGHLEAAAGIAGVIKAILSLKKRAIPKHVNFKTLNPRINLDAIPARLPKHLSPFEKSSSPLSASVSSFGFSGTNGHVILQEWIEEKTPPSKSKELRNYGFAFSAQSEISFYSYLQKFIDYLEKSADDTSLEEIQKNLLIGRAQLKYRKVIFGKNKGELIEKITEAPTPSKIKKKTKTLTFIDDKPISEESSLFFYNNYLEFRNKFEKCLKCFPISTEFFKERKLSFSNQKEKDIFIFCFHYALIKLYEDFGLPFHTFHGEGKGFFLALALSEAIPLKISAQLFMKSLEDALGKSREIVSFSRPKYSLLDFAFDKKYLERDLASFPRQKTAIKKEEYDLILSLEECLSEEQMIEKLLLFFEGGINIEWSKVMVSKSSRKLALPNYCFDKSEFWIQARKNRPQVEIDENPMVGNEILSPLSSYQHRFLITEKNLPEMKDTHNVLHIGYILKMALTIAERGLNKKMHEVELCHFHFDKALYVHSTRFPIYGVLDSQFSLFTQDSSEGNWEKHLFGEVNTPKKDIKHPELPGKLGKPDLDHDTFYQMMDKRGVSLGKSVRCVDKVWVDSSQVIAKLTTHRTSEFPYGVFDAMAQLFHLFLQENEPHAKLMVVKWEKARFFQSHFKESFYCIIRKDESQSDSQNICGNGTLYSEEGTALFSCLGLELKRLSSNSNVENLLDSSLIENFINQRNQKKKEKLMREILIKVISHLLKIDSDDCSDEETLFDIGFDSIMGMDLKSYFFEKLQVDFGIDLLFQNPTIKEIAKILTTQNQVVPIQSSNPWLKGDLEDTKTPRLYCLPYGCGGASEYLPWTKKLKPHLNVIAIQLPGREERIEEPPFSSLNELVKTICEILESQPDVPFVFYGHSMGALLAFQVMRELRKKKKKLPEILFVGAYSSPSILPNPWLKVLKKKIDPLPKTEEEMKKAYPLLLEWLKGGAEELSSLDNEYITRLVPTMWADLHLIDGFQSKKIQPFDLPIVVFSGKKDERVSKKDSKAWKVYTKEKFEWIELKGDHFFLQKDQSQDKLIEIIGEKVETNHEKQQ